MKDKDLNFEKALADLEAVVDKLEKGGLNLNESLAQFEKGVKLARFLREELDKAEKKVEILLKDDKGGLRSEAFGAEGEESVADAADAEEDEEEDDDGEAAEEDAPKTKTKPGRGGKKKDDDESLPF
jgi:exodeoxyribonuclease VII small subunit